MPQLLLRIDNNQTGFERRGLQFSIRGDECELPRVGLKLLFQHQGRGQMQAIGAAETICAGSVKRAKYDRWGYVFRRKRCQSLSNEAHFGSNSSSVTSPAFRLRAIVEPTSISPSGEQASIGSCSNKTSTASLPVSWKYRFAQALESK